MTFGQLMQTIYSLVEPGRTIRPPEPWNVLEGISLDGAEFFLYFDKPQGGADGPGSVCPTRLLLKPISFSAR